MVNHEFMPDSARELCESQTSLGEDFANKDEGLFCDMDEKKLYKICKGRNDGHGGWDLGRCFDWDERRLVDMQPAPLREGVLHRRAYLREPYEVHEEWHMEGNKQVIYRINVAQAAD